MSIVAKALWYIENRYGQPGLSLDEVAAACQVSRFHLTRAFGMATGLSLMRYLRARRMTEAAQALAAGAPDILAVALDAGYGSHEAFTRAFREQFGCTPEAVRAQGHCEGHGTGARDPARSPDAGVDGGAASG
jgi:AraC family transcriptional regulator